MNKGSIKDLRKGLAKDFQALIILVVLVIALAVMTPLFLTGANIINVLRQVCVSAIMAVGFAGLLGSGHMDLSVGSILGITGILIAKLMVGTGLPLWLILLIGLAFGTLAGALNAVLINFGFPFFVATLATQQIWRGLCYITTDMVAVTNLPDEFVFIGQGTIYGIPVSVFIMLVMVILVWFIINRTVYGRYILALGGNEQATRVCGINTKVIRIMAFGLMGFCVSVAAIVTTGRAASAQISAGLNMEMDAIAAVVIGGTPMSGGSANIIGALIGCLIVGVLNNGLNLMKVDANWQTVAKGFLILFAIVLDLLSKKGMKKG